MADPKKVRGQRKPTGQDLDRQYDEQHTPHDADSHPTPLERRLEKEEALEDYAEDLKDPD